jgi:hypothetical protein
VSGSRSSRILSLLLPMGAGESRFAGGALGLHVLRIAEGSPAAEAGLEPFFDFVVAAGGVPVVSSPSLLVAGCMSDDLHGTL